MEPLNIFDDVELPLGAEVIQEFFKHKNIRLEKIVSNQSSSPDDFLYDQEEDEWLIVLQGSATLLVEDKKVFLKSGDSYFLRKHQKHKVLETSAEGKTVWLACFIS